MYRRVVLNPKFPLAGESVLIPKTDRQAQKQPCAPYWNADKELCLARHRELQAHDDVDHPSSSVQVLDTEFNLRSWGLIVMMYMLLPFPWQKSSYFSPFVLTGIWNFFKWIPPLHSSPLLSSLVKSFSAIHPQV